MADPNVGLLLSTTLKNYRKTLVDNIHRSNAVWAWMQQNGAMKEEDGGERIVVPVMYGKNSTAKSYTGYEQLDTTPQTGIDSAEYQWKQYSVTIAISGQEERINSGSNKIIDVLEARTKQAELSLKEAMTTDLFSDGTGNGSKALTGLEAMVATTGTYGAISSSAQTWWQAGYVETTSEALGLPKIRTLYNSVSIGGRDTPDVAVTTQTLFEKYEGLGTASIQLQAPGVKKLNDLGFQAQSFKGMPIVWDEQCPPGTWYNLNTKHMKLVAHKKANFDTSDFVKPENQDVRLAQVLWMGNLTCDRRKSFGKLTAKT